MRVEDVSVQALYGQKRARPAITSSSSLTEREAYVVQRKIACFWTVLPSIVISQNRNSSYLLIPLYLSSARRR